MGYIYVCVCVCMCVGGRYAKRLENSEYYVPFLKIHNTNQQIEGPDKFCNIPVDQLQLTKTPMIFMDLDDAFSHLPGQDVFLPYQLFPPYFRYTLFFSLDQVTVGKSS